MEATITSKELDMVLDSSKLGKAPGPDGLSLSYYKTIWDALSPCHISLNWSMMIRQALSPQRENSDNTIRADDLIHSARSRTQPMLLLSTDAEKAFDWVDWQFLWSTLQHMGTHIQFWSQALYTQLTAAFRVNETHSEYFPLCNRRRQGCPLSPLMFILTLKPFLSMVRLEIAIRGLRVSNL